jgi:hypothetical protein
MFSKLFSFRPDCVGHCKPRCNSKSQKQKTGNAETSVTHRFPRKCSKNLKYALRFQAVASIMTRRCLNVHVNLHLKNGLVTARVPRLCARYSLLPPTL